jgi:glycine cleavage system H lipoate-binding protein/formate hydrogenlyase subunit 6/NADH:ubiquinone oxidoreductase subunit I
MTLLEAARSAGIDIPTLCYHPELRPYGACRLCTVEVGQQGRVRLQASCALPAENGMEVKTASERVLRGRRMIIELLLARAPDAPVLRELATRFGAREGRLAPKNEKCILCGQCVAVCAEVVGVAAIGFAGRGVTRRVTTPFEAPSLTCLACGACTFVCPTGAIDMERTTLERIKAERSPRYCRYSRMGMIPDTLCPNAYECYRCDVDQRMEDICGTHPAFVASSIRRAQRAVVRDFQIEQGRYYHPRHLWMEPLNSHVRMGFDDFAQRLVGPVLEVKPVKEPGTRAQAGDILVELLLPHERTVSVVAPVSGQVVSFNEDLILDPTLLHKAPYSRGWICEIAPSAGHTELAKFPFWQAAIPYLRLVRDEPVAAWMTGEVEKLRSLLSGCLPDMLTEGDLLRANLPEVLSHEDWQTVKQAFLAA